MCIPPNKHHNICQKIVQVCSCILVCLDVMKICVPRRYISHFLSLYPVFSQCLKKSKHGFSSKLIISVPAATGCTFASYRMEEPKELQELQTAEWEPILQWACDRYRIHFFISFTWKVKALAGWKNKSWATKTTVTTIQLLVILMLKKHLVNI